MRITFVLPPLNSSGGMRVLALYAERLRRRGHRVVVVATRPPGPTLARRIVRTLKGKIPPPWVKGPSRVTHFERSGVDLRELRHSDPVTDADVPDADLVVATWWATAPMVAAMSPTKGRKAYFIQGYESSIESVPAAEADATWRLPMRKIVVAEWLAALARDKFGDPTAVCVPKSVDTTLFFAPPRGKHERPTVGFIHAPFPTKGTDLATDAIVRARTLAPELRVISFGHSVPGPDFPIPDWFEFTQRPAQEKLRELYAACDVFVQPSRVEGFGLPILEAMACRTPVVATPAGAAPELLRGGGGKLVAHDAPDEMAAAIVEIATAPEGAWRRWSDAGLATAQAYSWDAAAAAFERALEDISRAPVPTLA
jgi:glycosyltransferase involved in cell wall biosynthesis